MVVWPLSAFVRLWWRTIRVRITDDDLEVVTRHDGPTVFLLWHNRLFLAAEMARRFRGSRPLYSLVSASKDGAWLTTLLSSLGLGVVRGSSSRLGREAATELVEVLRAGHDVGITPDGPRGPCYELKPGALVVARRAPARVVLSGFDFECSWRLSSWDGFHIPMPFSIVHMKFAESGPDELDDRDEAARDLGRRMAELNPDRKPAPVRSRARA